MNLIKEIFWIILKLPNGFFFQLPMIKYGGNDDLKKEMVNIQAEIRENILSLGLAGLKNKIVSISQVLYGVKGSQSKKKKILW